MIVAACYVCRLPVLRSAWQSGRARKAQIGGDHLPTRLRHDKCPPMREAGPK